MTALFPSAVIVKSSKPDDVRDRGEIDCVFPIGEVPDHVVSVAGGKYECVRAGAARESVVARSADQLVAAFTAIKPVVVLTAIERVVALTAKKPVDVLTAI